MGRRVIILSVLLLTIPALAKRLTIYDKREKPMHIEIPDDTKEENDKLEPCNSERPYIVWSKRDKKRFELMLKTMKHAQDPNLLPLD